MNMHATNLKHFLEDSLTEKVVFLRGDNFLSVNVEAAIPIEVQVPFECFIKTVFSSRYHMALVVLNTVRSYYAETN